MRREGKEAHCEGCGELNPEVRDGYTVCCGELVCCGNGGYTERFGTPTDYVRACCWAEAEKEFEKAGRAIPDGSSRLFDR